MSAVDSDQGRQARRGFLRLLGLASLGVAASLGPARAAPSDNTTRGAAWLLGDNLSIAALLYNQGAAQDSVQHFLSNAKTIADSLGVEIKPFPAKAADSSEASADLVHYLIAGDGAAVGTALAQKYDDELGILFEVAVKSNLLILLYGPGDSLGRSIAQVIKSRLQAINLPDRLWSHVVSLVYSNASADDVKAAVFQMHKDIANFFIPGSG